MSQTCAILWAKWRMARHTAASVRHESKLKVSFITVSAVCLWLGAFGLFYFGLDWLRAFGTETAGSFGIGEIVMRRLFAVLALALFFMLIFSNVLVSFATLYRAKEVAYLVQSPISWPKFFLVRFLECVAFSSWASAYIGSPLVLAWGLVTDASPAIYAAALLYFIPFVTIPAAIGSIITLILARVFPALNRGVLIAIGTAAVGAFFLYVRGKFSALRLSEDAFVTNLLDATAQVQSPLLPSYWFSHGMLTAGAGQYAESIFNFLLLLANALLLTWVAAELAQRIYYDGWSAMLGQDRVRERPLGRGVLGRLDALLSIIREPIRSLVVKDVKLFWRDPTQWSQFIIFFGLMAVYIANLGNRGWQSGNEAYRAWISCLNMGACALILATLTSRFVYPLISLEGRRFWIIGLAPFSFRRLVWQKFALSVATTSVFTLSLAILSGIQLELRPLWFFMSVYTVIVANFSLSGLAVGLGSLYPNFQEDNPARIVSGMGGTLNFLLSFGYIALIVSAQTVVLVREVLYRNMSAAEFWTGFAVAMAFVTLLSAVTTLLPLRLGLRNLQAMEF